MTPIKTVTMYQTSDGQTFYGESSAIGHQEDIDAAQRANEQLESGKSIGEILQAAGKTVPDDILFRVTKDSQLVISWWQCKDTPGYMPRRFNPDGKVYVYGDVGSWSGSYGGDVSIADLIRYAKDNASVLGGKTA